MIIKGKRGKKEAGKTLIVPKGDKSMYLISSLEYELRMLEKMRKGIEKKVVPKISAF